MVLLHDALEIWQLCEIYDNFYFFKISFIAGDKKGQCIANKMKSMKQKAL